MRLFYGMKSNLYNVLSYIAMKNNKYKYRAFHRGC